MEVPYLGNIENYGTVGQYCQQYNYNGVQQTSPELHCLFPLLVIVEELVLGFVNQVNAEQCNDSGLTGLADILLFNLDFCPFAVLNFCIVLE